MLKFAPALAVSALLLSPASAAPMAPNMLDLLSDSHVIQVRDGHGKGHGKGHGHHGKNHGHHGRHHGHHGKRHGHHGGRHHHHHHGHRWMAGHRYHSAPPGWRRYGARPWDWQARGCVLVSPIWFCP